MKAKVYWSTIPHFYRISLNIVHSEMMNAMVALRLWGPEYVDQKVRIVTMLQLLNNGASIDPFLSSCAQTIWLLKAKYNSSDSLQPNFSI